MTVDSYHMALLRQLVDIQVYPKRVKSKRWHKGTPTLKGRVT